MKNQKAYVLGLLYGTQSQCCHTQSLIVQSRSGGFVSQNCIECGKPRKILLQCFPALHCNVCKTKLVIGYIGKNYAYKCSNCKSEFEVYTITPHWSAFFDYHGLGLESDLAPNMTDYAEKYDILSGESKKKIKEHISRMLTTQQQD